MGGFQTPRSPDPPDWGSRGGTLDPNLNLNPYKPPGKAPGGLYRMYFHSHRAGKGQLGIGMNP